MAEHPGLHDLVRLADAGGDTTDGIFKCDAGDVGAHKGADKFKRLFGERGASGATLIPVQAGGA